MSKQLTPLEALERLLITFKPYVDENKYIKRDFNIIETALKALEIIKKRFWLDDFQDFVSFNGMLPKSFKEEFDLLKEVLK